MWFIPYEKFKIDIDYPSDQVSSRLSSIVEPYKLFRSSSKHKDYEGNIKSNKFSILPIAYYRNSFVPLIEGTIKGRTVYITIRPKNSSLFFAIFMVGCAIKFGQTSFLNALEILAFGYILILGGFRFEASDAKDTLIDLLK
ncbi:MAG: hypothetical protein ABFD08_02600 [Syntrophomonas sp.]